MGGLNTYNVCHGGEEMPMGYTTNTCVLCSHVIYYLYVGWLHDGEHLYICGCKLKL